MLVVRVDGSYDFVNLSRPSMWHPVVLEAIDLELFFFCFFLEWYRHNQIGTQSWQPRWWGSRLRQWEPQIDEPLVE